MSQHVIYGAGPIDLGKDIPNWRGQLVELLGKAGVDAVMFDPSTSYKLSRLGTQADRRDAYIEAVNRQALEMADIMVVVLPHGVQSIGTPIEIDMASNLGKKIILITDIPRGKSVYLNNRIVVADWIWVKDLQNPDDFLRIGLSQAVRKILGTDNVI